MNPIEYQIAELKQTLFAPDTAKVYAQASSKTWKLLQQIAMLALLLGLLSIAAAVWVWTVGWRSGSSFRYWLETEQPPLERIVAEAFRAFGYPFQKLAHWSEFQLKELLAQQDIEAIAAAPLSKLLSVGKK